MEVSLMPCVSQKHSPSGWRRAPYKQRVRAPESVSTPETFHFFIPKNAVRKDGGEHLPYKQRVRTPESASTPETFHFFIPKSRI